MSSEFQPHTSPYPTVTDVRVEALEERIERIEREGLTVAVAQLLGDVRELRAEVRGWNTDTGRRVDNLEARMAESEKDRRQIREFLDMTRGGGTRMKDFITYGVITVFLALNVVLGALTAFGGP